MAFCNGDLASVSGHLVGPNKMEDGIDFGGTGSIPEASVLIDVLVECRDNSGRSVCFLQQQNDVVRGYFCSVKG